MAKKLLALTLALVLIGGVTVLADVDAGFSQGPSVTEFRMTLDSLAIEMPMTMNSFSLGWQTGFTVLGAGLYTQPMINFDNKWKPAGFSFAIGSEFEVSRYTFQAELGINKPSWTKLKDWQWVPKISLLFNFDAIFNQPETG